jgi:hypothetical protein
VDSSLYKKEEVIFLELVLSLQMISLLKQVVKMIKKTISTVQKIQESDILALVTGSKEAA